MLQVKNLEKRFGGRVLLNEASLIVNTGERVALFGKNGSGKSTLFKMITGEETPDRGEIATPKGYQIGHLRQHLSFTESTIIDEACLALAGDKDAERYKAEIILAGLGFTEEEIEASPASVSGGFQIRINLAKLILSEPNMLLLDEPTNYLDIVSLRWLERFLRNWRGELIVISHDRSFCDAVSSHSVLVYRGSLKKVEGDSEKLYSQVAEEEDLYERTRENREKQVRKMEAFISRFRAKASKASVVQSRVKALEKIERLDELQQEDALDFAFSSAPFPGRFPVEVRGLSFGYENGPTIVSDLEFALKKDDRIGIIGRNGKGKSTLLRLIAGNLQPRAGEVILSPNTKIGFFGQTNVNRLDLSFSVEDEVRSVNPKLSRTQIRGICGAMMFEGDDALKKIKVLSGGEKSRVLLGKILAAPSNVLLLDEPTNHLDVESVIALTDALEQFDGAALVVTHDEELLRRIATRLIVFQGTEPFMFEGSYDEFLDSIGWDEEQEAGPSSNRRPQKAKGTNASTPRDAKRDKAELLQERSKIIAPLKKSVSTAEEKISRLERDIEANYKLLSDASAKADGAAISKIGKQLDAAKRELERSMSEWEKASEVLSRTETDFESRLVAVEE
jgi:ATP-binding cassette subfamily F protein 3